VGRAAAVDDRGAVLVAAGRQATNDRAGVGEARREEVDERLGLAAEAELASAKDGLVLEPLTGGLVDRAADEPVVEEHVDALVEHDPSEDQARRQLDLDAAELEDPRVGRAVEAERRRVRQPVPGKRVRTVGDGVERTGGTVRPHPRRGRRQDQEVAVPRELVEVVPRQPREHWQQSTPQSR
jgi:hypothetical protein